MSTVRELIESAHGFAMPSLSRLRRLRHRRATDPMNPMQTVESDETDELLFSGFIASSTGSESEDGNRASTSTTATLTVPDPGIDIIRGDVIVMESDEKRRWKVVGFPLTEGNPFTGWNPTLEASLEEVVG